MKSVRTKLIASILICSLFTSVLIGMIAISNSVRTAGKDAMTMMQLTGQKKTEEINSTIQKIEQSVDTLSEVAMSNFDYDSFRQSKDYADTYTETVQQAVLDFANHTNGAVTAYLRYNPDYSNPTSGVFAQRQSVDSELQCLTPTDFSMYDESDVEHVGWYYTPIKTKKPTWMMPYLNKNISVYMISYVIPLFKFDTEIGVVGVDIDFDYLTREIASIRLFDNDYAFLADKNGNILFHPSIPKGHPFTLPENSLFIHNKLENGMDLTFVIPKESMDRIAEIQASAKSTLFEGRDLYLLDAVDVGEYAHGKATKRSLIALEFGL